jgi:predicted dehydrogenase
VIGGRGASDRRLAMRAALVGTGAIARQHLSCLSRLAGVDLVAVCDLSRASAEFARERYGAADWFTDHREMLAASRPDVVHITTPVTSHYALASDALDAGAHVIVEKPITVDDDQLERLLEHADRAGLSVVEDYNYLFNPPVQDLLDLVQHGVLGEVVHADITFCSDVLAPGSAFTDTGLPHPATMLPGGAIGDFITHLAALSHAVSGEHRTVQAVWSHEDRPQGMATDMVALVRAERGTATLRFSARARPETFVMRVSGTTLSATASIFGERLLIERDATWRRPLQMVRRGVDAGVRSSLGSLAGPWGRLSGGPGAYVGIGRLIERTYAALSSGQPVPVQPAQIRAVNRLRTEILRTYPGRT